MQYCTDYLGNKYSTEQIIYNAKVITVSLVRLRLEA